MEDQKPGDTIFVSKVELAGWGGGPGMTFAIRLIGNATVRMAPDFPGLIEYTADEDIFDDPFRNERKQLYKKGDVLLFAPNHVRLMEAV